MITKQKLQVGDMITIQDFSYTGRIGSDGQMTHRGNLEPNCYQQFKVLIIGCKIPTYIFMGEWRVADTVVIGQKDGTVWFVHSDLVRQVLPKHILVIDGKIIELSHESFLNLKKQFYFS